MYVKKSTTRIFCTVYCMSSKIELFCITKKFNLLYKIKFTDTTADKMSSCRGLLSLSHEHVDMTAEAYYRYHMNIDMASL
ncbi:oxoc10 [Oxyplax ochracea nucleopolyhedrovirus]|uniref:Oxoc10 n=1 Tax=Oxyplax ochracea nucleopolyhedrovirus TaxID=2083176 RepID=A0A2L0WTY3_9ABAC|nr:oxoc10 [Oxyplax ochracea nucleopolyhedrovirus]AVA31109.1 oxoc10 [Oxyplax ochracea nucleopolyhedrovirus]